MSRKGKKYHYTPEAMLVAATWIARKRDQVQPQMLDVWTLQTAHELSQYIRENGLELVHSGEPRH